MSHKFIKTMSKEIKPNSFARFGKKVSISPKATASINKAGYKKEFYVDSVSVMIGIGKDHAAELVMDVESWEALKNGAEVSVTTTNEFKKNL